MPLDTLPQWLAMGLPKSVAIAQAKVDRHKAVLRMREVGLTFRAMGEKLGVSHGRARQIFESAKRIQQYGSHFKSPFERWSADQSEATEVFRRAVVRKAPKPKPTDQEKDAIRKATAPLKREVEHLRMRVRVLEGECARYNVNRLLSENESLKAGFREAIADLERAYDRIDELEGRSNAA